MNITYSKIYSESLGREIEYKIYGHGGKPIIVFPSSGGRFYEYEDFGMVGSISDFIEEGKIILITPDSIDSETWLNYGGYPADRARRHNAYD
ncbi:MAG: esterase, partial [Clostridiaceae bacterium]